MSDTVIKVENLGKKYLIKHEQRERYTALRDVMASKFKSFGSKIFSPFTFHRSPFTDSKEDFWALKDVSFEIKQGERVGIIGRNGAGKTTLLKLLSRITEPTTGRITLRGRVASLLEVGTGFHPELTGRENIFLNGAILGMSKFEIKKKFDEIVDFAEIEKFLDTPVKRYSSGMYVRLAFAVAAHLEPEILIVDEVLAVGDAQFQKKCLWKMEDVGREGRTVLFVSHNMGAISALCSQALMLESGKLLCKGKTDAIIQRYLHSQKNNLNIIEKSDIQDPDKEVIFQSAWTETLTGERKFQFQLHEPFYIGFTYKVKKIIPKALIAMRIETIGGEIIIDSWDSDSLEQQEVFPGLYSVRVKVDYQDLHPGIYQISLIAVIHLVRWIDRVSAATEIEILPISEKKVWRSERKAILARILEWERRYEKELSA